MEFTNFENPEITKEDKNMHYECITEVEKNFINFIRNFRTQEWLKGMTLELTEDAISDMVDLSLGEIAFESALQFKDICKSDVQETYRRFNDIKDNIEKYVDPQEMEELVKQWGKMVKSSVVCDLIELSDSTEFLEEKSIDKNN